MRVIYVKLNSGRCITRENELSLIFQMIYLCVNFIYMRLSCFVLCTRKGMISDMALVCRILSSLASVGRGYKSVVDILNPSLNETSSESEI